MVSLKLEVKKKDLTWLIPLFAVLVVGVVYAYTTDGSGNPSVMGHSAGEIEGVCRTDGTGCPSLSSIPAGAVMAFDLSACPTGWTELVSARGRTIVGLNPGDASFDTRGETGGEKTHTLTVAEMPSHRHTITIIKGAYHTGRPDYPGYLGHGNYNANVAETFTGNNDGGNQPHNNLQPYIAFIYCKKN